MSVEGWSEVARTLRAWLAAERSYQTAREAADALVMERDVAWREHSAAMTALRDKIKASLDD